MIKQIAVVIVNWNKKKDVLTLLSELNNISDPLFDVYVVDNASTDDSVEAIKKNFPAIFLILNPSNLGGTGGFNSGMHEVMKQQKYDYIWLLDNDAIVESETLKGLIHVMESNNDIGVVGSLICHPDKPDIVIEQGGWVDWNQGLWKAWYLNKKRSQLTEDIKDVDYVAACSMLIRIDVLQQIGFFDSRMFIHWDDVEFCLRVKKKGYRVVSTKESVVYHYAEKQSPTIYIYYNFRNALLTMSRHLHGLKKILILYMQAKKIFKGKILAQLLNDRKAYQIFNYALKDFYSGDFKKFRYKTPDESFENRFNMIDNARNYNEFLILPYGTVYEMIDCAKHIKALSPDNKVTIMIQKERAKLINNNSCFDHFFYYKGERESFISTIKTLIRLLFSSPVVGVFVQKNVILPFYPLALKISLIYDQDNSKFFYSNYNRKAIWKLLPSFILGELAALFSLPRLLWASKKINSKSPEL
ncbi:glycosyltransferase family 2 protein [Desulfobacula toluolica]|uniref:Predicted glycosyl transferase, family 2 n=1 Tax=Desulfobacula toluolica (strain DSM 7467 / Tol2) TaxID=651182 RepID=K0NGF7_DESTT|nr:glycosyltransferase family 2 protein [Desulfobacula toluolica]CCK80301.1 predicted glycosyl transferase, family 2 [Desulfobacula toluolica Tol2]